MAGSPKRRNAELSAALQFFLELVGAVTWNELAVYTIATLRT